MFSPYKICDVAVVQDLGGAFLHTWRSAPPHLEERSSTSGGALLQMWRSAPSHLEERSPRCTYVEQCFSRCGGLLLQAPPRPYLRVDAVERLVDGGGGVVAVLPDYAVGLPDNQVKYSKQMF